MCGLPLIKQYLEEVWSNSDGAHIWERKDGSSEAVGAVQDGFTSFLHTSFVTLAGCFASVSPSLHQMLLGGS